MHGGHPIDSSIPSYKDLQLKQGQKSTLLVRAEGESSLNMLGGTTALICSWTIASTAFGTYGGYEYPDPRLVKFKRPNVRTY